MERDHRAPEVHLAPSLIHHAAKHLREPVGQAREGTDEGDREEGEVEVRDHKVAVVQVDVCAARAQRNAGDAPDEERKHEPERPEHRCRETDGSSVEGGDVQEHHLRDGDGDQHRGDGEHVRHPRVDARDELVMSPHEEGQHARGDGGQQDEAVTEQLLTREDRDDLGHHACGRQEDHVHLGVPEEPEQVLPEDRVATLTRVVEARPERLVEDEHDRAGEQGPDRQHEQDARDADHPHDHGYVVPTHAWGAGVHARDNEVDPPDQEGHKLEPHRCDPEGAPKGSEAVSVVRGERRVRRPRTTEAAARHEQRGHDDD